MEILLPQALVNMGEILKAAGCGYENGEKNFTVWNVFELITSKLTWRRILLSQTQTYILSLLPAVVKTTVLLADMKDFTDVNDVYKQCKYCSFTYQNDFLFCNFSLLLSRACGLLRQMFIICILQYKLCHQVSAQSREPALTRRAHWWLNKWLSLGWLEAV